MAKRLVGLTGALVNGLLRALHTFAELIACFADWLTWGPRWPYVHTELEKP